MTWLVLVTTTVSVVAVGSAAAQDPIVSQDFNVTAGGPESDAGFRVVETDDGGYAMAGFTESFGEGDLFGDAWLYKVDGQGNVEINRTYGGPADDRFRDLVQTPDGGYALVGRTASYGAGERDGWLVKVDAQGDEEFNVTYGGTDFDQLQSIETTDTGGYTLVGSRDLTPGGQGWFLRVNHSGSVVTERTYGVDGAIDRFADHVVTSSGGLAIAGTTQGFAENGGTDLWLVTTDGDGVEAFNASYGFSDDERGFGITQTASGGYALAGNTDSLGDSSDMWVVKTDGTGTAEYTEKYEIDDRNSAGGLFDVTRTDDGGFLFSGGYGVFSSDTDAVLLKTGADGSKQYDLELGAERGHGVLVDGDGDIVVGGSTGSPGRQTDLWLTKLGVVDPATCSSGSIAEIESQTEWSQGDTNLSGLGDVTIVSGGIELDGNQEGSYVSTLFDRPETVLQEITVDGTFDAAEGESILFGVATSTEPFGDSFTDLQSVTFRGYRLQEGQSVYQIDGDQGTFAERYARIGIVLNAGDDLTTTPRVDAVHLNGLNCGEREVDIEIKPPGEDSPINPHQQGGLVPVAIENTSTFDPGIVDVGSLRFGATDVVEAGDGATAAHAGHFDDVDDDGDLDLVVHFPVEDAGFDGDEAEGRLEGETQDGTPLFGTDGVTTVGGGAGARGNGQP